MTTRRWDKSKPPAGPWVLNTDSLQAQGLLVWVPLNAGASAGKSQYDYAGRRNAHATSGSGLLSASRDKWGAPSITTNGSSDYFKTPSIGASFLQTSKWMAFVAGTQKFTWSNWLRGTAAGWEVGEHFTGGKASMILCNSDATAYYGREETTSSADGLPHDYLFVHDGSLSTTSRISLYKDGVSAATTSATIGGGNPGTLTENGMSFGRTDGTPANYRTGTISDLRVYDSIDLAAQIAASIYNPATRFELFYPLRSRKWMVVGGGGAYALTASTAAFSLTGNATTLKATRKLTAATATYALTGNAANLLRGLKLSAAAASYAWTGNAAGLSATRRLSAAVATYVLTGNAAILKVARRMSAGTATYSFTGNAANLVYTPLGAYSLSASAAAYTLTGNAAGQRADRRLAASAGIFNFTGTAASLLRGYRLAATVQTYALTGSAASLVKSSSYSMAASTASYGWTGNAATLIYSGAPAVVRYASRTRQILTQRELREITTQRTFRSIAP